MNNGFVKTGGKDNPWRRNSKPHFQIAILPIITSEMFDPAILHPFLTFKAVRSSGKGGQHVNKVSTAVELYFDVLRNRVLNEDQKQLILDRLKNRISSEGILIVVSQTERSQLANKKKVIERFDRLIGHALMKKAKRIATRISKTQKAKRLDSKKKHSEKKHLRRKSFD